MDIYKNWIIHGALCVPRYQNSVAPRYPAQLTAATIAGGTLNIADYYYKVTGVDSSGSLLTWISNEASATTTPGNQQIDLTWDEIPGATGYIIYRGTASQGQNLQLAVGPSVNIIDTGSLGWGAGSPSGTEQSQKVMRNIALGGATFVGMSGTIAEATDITGFAGGVDGRLLILYFENTSRITIRNGSVWSSAANRIETLRSQACTADWHLPRQVRQWFGGVDLDGRTVHGFIWHPNIVAGSGRWLYLFANGDNQG